MAGGFIAGEEAVRARDGARFEGKLSLIPEELELLRKRRPLPDGGTPFVFLAHQLRYAARGNCAGVIEVIDPERQAFMHAREAGFDEGREIRERVRGFEEARIGGDPFEVVSRARRRAEGHAQAPDVSLGGIVRHPLEPVYPGIAFAPAQNLFAQSLGAAVETARWRAEGEVGAILFGEAIALRPVAGKDAPAGDVAPGDFKVPASRPDDTGDNGVGKEAGGFVALAGIDVWPPHIADAIDNKRGVAPSQSFPQRGCGRPIDFVSGDRRKGHLLAAHFLAEEAPDVPTGSQKNNHRPRLS